MFDNSSAVNLWHRVRKAFADFIVLAIATVFLSAAAFFNRYPLVYSDTGTYMHSGIMRMVPDDRPIIYGLFAEHISFSFSLWPIILFQAFLLAYVLMLTCKTLLLETYKHLYFLVAVGILIYFTGVSICSSIILPDIFTPLLFLTFLLLILKNDWKNLEFLIIVSIFVFSVMVHGSNIPLVILLFIFSVVAYIRYYKQNVFHYNKLFVIGGIISLSLISLPFIHHHYGGGYSLTRGSHVYFIARMAENGVLDKLLEKECASKNYTLCAFRNKFPNRAANFIYADSILIKNGGWNGSKSEFNELILKSFSSFEFLILHLSESFTASCKQFFNFDVSSGLSPYRQGSAPFGIVSWEYPNEVNQYLSSRQATSELNFSKLNTRQNFIFWLSGLALAIIYFSKRISSTLTNPMILTLYFALYFLIANAFVCGTFANVYARLQNRVVWVLPFLLCIAFVMHIKNRNVESKHHKN